jgi:small neutral amino acid transporter SnatA (MarC family)
MQTTFSAGPSSIAICSSRSTRRRLQAVAAIFAVVAVVGVSWMLVAASLFVSGTSGVVTYLAV